MPITYDGFDFERPGHATVRIKTPGGTVIYVDPWSQVLSGTPHDADLVFVTHADFDHYDPEGIDAVSDDETTLVVFERVDTSDLDRSVRAIRAEEALSIDGVDVHTVNAYNRPDGDHVDDEGEPFHAEGDGIGLLLTVGGTTVFVPGDTDVLPVHEQLRADVVLPPIGGHYTMDRHEAVDLVRAIDPDLVLPVHYDTFERIETDATAFQSDLADQNVRVELF